MSTTGYVSCPNCGDNMPKRVGQTDTFFCPSCGSKFSAEGYAFGTERPP